ncbi:MAG TPA: HAD family hydrolase, partial [Epsilonproteobacteria bacterium]|nr:HAD family hydrolase [Campylobacterota bacterium]
MKKIILFDLDGTLIDSTEAILESFTVAFKTFQ